MTLHRNLLMICLFCLGFLSSASQAYVLQAPNQSNAQTSESILPSPFASQETTVIQWASLEPKSRPEFFKESSESQSNHFVTIPNHVGLTNEFHEMSSRHSVINTDQSKRFYAPEPSAWLMMCVGLLGLILVRRRNATKQIS